MASGHGYIYIYSAMDRQGVWPKSTGKLKAVKMEYLIKRSVAEVGGKVFCAR